MPDGAFVTGLLLFLAAAFVLRRVAGCMVQLALLAVVAMIALLLVGPRYLGTAVTANAASQMNAGALTAGQGAWAASRVVRHAIVQTVRSSARHP